MTFKAVTNFPEVNSELDECSKAIQVKASELADTREKSLLAKALYEKEYSRFLLEAKLNEPEMVQSEIQAQARVKSYELKLEAVKAYSAYMRLLGEIKALERRLDALKEISYNLRKEALL